MCDLIMDHTTEQSSLDANGLEKEEEFKVDSVGPKVGHLKGAKDIEGFMEEDYL